MTKHRPLVSVSIILVVLAGQLGVLKACYDIASSLMLLVKTLGFEIPRFTFFVTSVFANQTWTLAAFFFIEALLLIVATSSQDRQFSIASFLAVQFGSSVVVYSVFLAALRTFLGSYFLTERIPFH